MTNKSVVLAGGCFWGLEHLLANFKGVIDTKAGYVGGQVKDPTYEDVKTGGSGHAEAVEVTFDSEKLSLRELLHFFFKIHDPTTINRQGNDLGSQYRSAIFVVNNQDKEVVNEVISEVNSLKTFPSAVVTQVETLEKFYLAEEFHQDYLIKNPNGYNCHYIRN